MTLNGVMAVTLRYLIEFGKHMFQHVTASICGGLFMHESIVFCSTFAISSPNEFLVRNPF